MLEKKIRRYKAMELHREMWTAGSHKAPAETAEKRQGAPGA